MADKEFTQICKEILGVSKRLEKIEPEELRKIKADIEQISATIVAHKASFDASKEDFDGKYSGITEIINTFDTLKAQIEEVLKSGTINDSAEALISTFSSKKIMNLLNEAKRVVDEKFSTIHKNGITPWNSTLEYPAGAISVLNGKLYQAKSQNTNKKPSENTDLWGVIVDDEWAKTNLLSKTDKTLISEYAHITHGQELPDGDYSSSDFWLSVKPGIYYAKDGKGRNKPAVYGLVEIISNGEVSVTWSYFGDVWKWYQGFNKSNSGWKKVVLGDATSAAQANSIVARDGNADFEARYVIAASFKSTADIDDRFTNAQGGVMFWSSDDRFIRPTSLAKLKEVINGVDFACQKNPNGYTKLPNGLILQWGSIMEGLAGERAFPIAFPNIVLAVIAGNTNAQGSAVDNAFAYAISKEKFYYGTKSSYGGAVSCFPGSYIAIGY